MTRYLEKYLILFDFSRFMALPSDKRPVDIDAVDAAILNSLIDDARLSFRAVAKAVGIAPATAQSRIRRLERAGVITKYTVGIKYSLIGYDMQVIIDLRISKGKLYEVERKIKSHPNVFAVYDNTGPFDATVIAKFQSRAALDRFLKEVQTYDFVERTETKLLLSTIKEHPIHLPVKQAPRRA